LFNSAINAQFKADSKWLDNWSVNANVGVNLYYGDIDNYRFFRIFENNNDWRLGTGFYLQRDMNDWFALRGQFVYGKLAGTKRASNIWFEGNVVESSVMAKADAMKLFWPHLYKDWSVFATGGLGMVSWKSQLMQRHTNEPLPGDIEIDPEKPDKRSYGLVMPLGIGADYWINDNFQVNFEMTIRMVSSDKLDNKTGGFDFDSYSYSFVGVSYYFDKRKPRKKPKMQPREYVQEEPAVQNRVNEPKVDQAEIAAYQQQVEQERSLEEKLMDAEAESGLYKTPWPGVEFMVQIAAAKKYIEPEVFAKKFDLRAAEIKVHIADGWYRYSIGKHIKYWQAREYRNVLLTNHDTKGAFVVAYRDDERIMLTDLVNAEPILEGAMSIQHRPKVDVGYAVQILATKHTNPPIIAIKEMFGIEETIFKEYSEGFYHYTVGKLDSMDEAVELRDKIRYRGIKSAFIVGYLDGERIVDIEED
jgi:hypothetical protein